MLEDINLPLILIAGLIGAASPGPATLAIAGTSMSSGRIYGLALAFGISSGSIIWSLTAAFGLGAIMLGHAWILETVRYLGAGYLIYLGYKSARSALTSKQAIVSGMAASSLSRTYTRGLILHLSNPKAILFFGALFTIGVPAGTPMSSLAVVILAVAIQSALIFHGYAILFSSKPMVASYLKFRRGFESVFAICFAAAGMKILTTRLQ